MKNRNKNKNKLIIKLISIICLLVLNLLLLLNSTYAVHVNSANIYSIGECPRLLKYKGVGVIVSYVEYKNGNLTYPAYCLDKTKPGVEKGEYTVSVSEAIQDVGLWRRIINGYPYKTLEQLGVASKEEAFTATKQAIYCYIHNNNPADYEAIGEAGQRTLNAMYKIINDANNSNETQISNSITINKNTSSWTQDENEKQYLSKTYSIISATTITDYKISINRENGRDLGGIKLTDEQNIEKDTFKPNEKFKILIPIKNLTQNGELNIKVETQVHTKPVLYGIAPNNGYQDYALTAATYEDGTGNIKDEYFKNETKITIIKKDEQTQENLQGVEFQLLNEQKEIIYTNLKTNEEGKVTIENLIPGKYYIKEAISIDGYQKYDELIAIESKLNEEILVTVNNKKEKKPTLETSQKHISVKKLPVTGM